MDAATRAARGKAESVIRQKDGPKFYCEKCGQMKSLKHRAHCGKKKS